MKQFNIFIFLVFISMGTIFGQSIRELSNTEKDEIARLTEMSQLYINEGDVENAGLTLSRIAFVYWKAGRPREAIDNFVSSADLFLQKKNYIEVKKIYSNIGVIYTDLEELEFALNFFEKSLEVRIKTGNKTDISAGLVDVAYILQVLRYNDDAIKKLEDALAIATKEKNPQLISDCYQLLSLNYEQIGNIKKANEYAGKYESYQVFLQEESLKEGFTKEVTVIEQKAAKTKLEKELADELFKVRRQLFEQTQDSLSFTIQSKQDSLFDAAQIAKARQLQIANLNMKQQNQQLAIEKQDAKAKNQRLIIIMVVVGLVLMIFLAIIMLRANRARKKANKKLEKQNKEIAEKSEQLGSALKKIAHQNQNITQSINYAKGIQQALLPKPEQLQTLISDSFILFKPRDIVSGDFYWFKEIDAKSDIFKIFGKNRRDKEDEEKNKQQSKKLAISAVDCTGHGVPGAFMSMIGYNLLDEITNKGITRPDLILEEMHRGVRTTLKQKETNNQDGMDMAMCVIDPEKKILEYAGAKNPLIYVQNGKITQIKGSKDGIGGKSDNHSFITHSINIAAPTWVYIFSDGYIDQFGGELGRKFMIKRFREMLFEIHKKPMKEQKEYLDQQIKSWVGTKYSQIDDILVMGFKIDLQ